MPHLLREKCTEEENREKMPNEIFDFSFFLQSRPILKITCFLFYCLSRVVQISSDILYHFKHSQCLSQKFRKQIKVQTIYFHFLIFANIQHWKYSFLLWHNSYTEEAKSEILKNTNYNPKNIYLTFRYLHQTCFTFFQFCVSHERKHHQIRHL